MMSSELYRMTINALDTLWEAESNADIGCQINLHPRSRGDFSSIIQAVDDTAQPKLYQYNHRIANENGAKYDTWYTRITMSANNEAGYSNITVFWPSPNYSTGVTP